LTRPSIFRAFLPRGPALASVVYPPLREDPSPNPHYFQSLPLPPFCPFILYRPLSINSASHLPLPPSLSTDPTLVFAATIWTSRSNLFAGYGTCPLLDLGQRPTAGAFPLRRSAQSFWPLASTLHASEFFACQVEFHFNGTWMRSSYYFGWVPPGSCPCWAFLRPTFVRLGGQNSFFFSANCAFPPLHTKTS